MRRVKLEESGRSVALEIPQFSQLAQARTNGASVISYGASPFLVCGRKWGINVYPNGHGKISRIDVYVHVYAKDGRETETEFLSWVQSKKLHFELTLTEPAPQVLNVSYSSHCHWSDMEDGAGWWYFGLDVASQLLELTNDTLLVSLKFDEKGPTPSNPISMRRSSKDGPVLLNPLALNRLNSMNAGKLETLYPLFPSANHDPAMLSLYNNPSLSDYAFRVKQTNDVGDDKLIHVQKCLLKAKLTAWVPQSPPLKSKSEPRKVIEDVKDFDYEVLNSFLTFVYSGQLPILEANNPANAASLGQLCILCERFGGQYQLRRFISRQFYMAVSLDNVVDLLQDLGGRSDFVQELVVFVICNNFNSIRDSCAFKDLISDCVVGRTREERCTSTKRLLAVLRRLRVLGGGRASVLETVFSDEGSPVIASVNSSLKPASSVEELPTSRRSTPSSSAVPPVPSLDPRRSIAFRTLLSTPSVSDVQFLVEGRTIYAQKCILASLSEFFQAMFSGPWSESHSEGPTIIEIVDFPHKTFQGMLNYLYLEELDPKSTLTDLGLLHICADKYQILDLMSLTESLISSQMSPANVSGFLFGFAHQYDSLNTLACQYFVDEFDAVKKTEEFIQVVRKPWEVGCTHDAWCKVWESVLQGLIVHGFEKVDVVFEESGGVDEYLDLSESDDRELEEGEGKEAEDKETDAQLETASPKLPSLRVEIRADRSDVGDELMLSAVEGYKSENEEYLDPQPMNFENEDGLDLEVMNLAKELSEAELMIGPSL
ncbi:UNVERIFIED_CONTAM: Rho- BTB domain-containing protein 2 [Siphonaria sp. JEL0065]|nr:Rho- BTB domain-containing protein 2 [Siphonaria sp. JEL0065]